MECQWRRVAAARSHVLRPRTTPAAARDAREATCVRTPNDYVHLVRIVHQISLPNIQRKIEKLFLIS